LTEITSHLDDLDARSRGLRTARDVGSARKVLDEAGKRLMALQRAALPPLPRATTGG